MKDILLLFLSGRRHRNPGAIGAGKRNPNDEAREFPLKVFRIGENRERSDTKCPVSPTASGGH